MKVFISLPIYNKSEDEIKQARNEAQEQVKTLVNDEVEFIDSWIYEEPPEDIRDSAKAGLWYLTKSLEHMIDADLVYCAQGWASFRGCKIEYAAAKNYGIKVVTYADYLTSKGYLK